MNNKMAVRGGAGDILEPKVGTRPQDNLYLAVNSEWLENVKIPSDRSRIASFDNIDLDVEKKLMKDFADFAETVFDFIRFYGLGEILDPSVYGKLDKFQFVDFMLDE